MKKVAIVTGGIRGIGAAISVMLQQNNYHVIASYNSSDDVAKEFSKKHNVEVMKWNVSDYQACQNAVEEIKAKHGQINVLVNNAGVTADGMLHKLDEAAWDKVLDTNLKSCFNMCRAVITDMREAKYGRIISLSSVNALAGQLGQTNYCASKAGIIGFTKALALESAIKGVTVNAIAPGYVETDMVKAMPEKVLESIVAKVPAGRLGKPEEIAKTVLFLADEAAGFITGETISVNGGLYLK